MLNQPIVFVGSRSRDPTRCAAAVLSFVCLLLGAVAEAGLCVQKPPEITPETWVAPAPDAVTPVEAKLDGALLELVRGQRDGRDAGASSDGGRVAVEIVCESPDHVAAVREQVVAAGGAVTASFEDHLWAEVPLAAVEGLAATPAVWTMALNRAVARPAR